VIDREFGDLEIVEPNSMRLGKLDRVRRQILRIIF